LSADLKNSGCWWQLYHHLFPEKARIVQCSATIARSGTVVAPRGGFHGIAAFLASNLLEQFFSFSRQKIIQISYMALKKDCGNLAVRRAYFRHLLFIQISKSIKYISI
jgi:hypothetical protein